MEKCKYIVMLKLARQRGVVIYLMLIAMGISVSVLLGGYASSPLQSKVTQREEIFKLLQIAKKNLISNSVTYADNYKPTGAGPGHLPCPNTDLPDGRRENDGPSPPCGQGIISIGRLAKVSSISGSNKVLAYQEGYYNATASFWYAVSNKFINNPFSIVNPGTIGDLKIDGQDDYIAIIAHAGEPIASQKDYRPSLSFQQYLEGENSDNDLEFSRFNSVSVNDIVLGITTKELMGPVKSRVAGFIVSWLGRYKQEHCVEDESLHCYPMAADNRSENCIDGLLSGWLAVGKGDCEETLFSANKLEDVEINRHWFIRNRWADYFRYDVSDACLSSLHLQCEIVVDASIPEGQGNLNITIQVPEV